MTALTVTWRPLEPPREPVAVLGEGRIVDELLQSARARVESGASLRAAAAPGTVLLQGDFDDLPWADGSTYLGREHGVLLPTTLTPDVSVDLLAQAARQLVRLRGHRALQLVLLPGRVVAFDLTDGYVVADRLVPLVSGEPL